MFCMKLIKYKISYYGLQYECLDDDPRARKEMESIIEVINQYSNNRGAIRKLALEYSEKKTQ